MADFNYIPPDSQRIAAQQGEKKSLLWWKAPKYEAHEIAWSVFKNIEENDKGREQQVLKHLRLYGNSDVYGIGPSYHDRTKSDEKLSLNVIKAACDAASSKIAKNRPAPRFLTTGGNWSLRRKGKRLEQWTLTQFDQTDTYDEGVRAFLDCAITGTGILHPYRVGKELCVERVLQTEVFVDRQEAASGKPRQMFRRKFVNRDWLYEVAEKEWQLPRSRLKCISEAKNPDPSKYGVNTTADQIEIIEAWHLPSVEGGSDGRHLIFVEGGCLIDRPWKHRRFPLIFMHWTRKPQGFWGIGLAEELTGIQLEINKLLIKIQKAFHLMANPVWFVDSATYNLIRKGHFNNEMGNVYPYASQPPTKHVQPSIHPEVFAHLDRLYQRAFEIAGISQLQVTAQHPPGVEAGVALRTLNDIQSERFSLVSKAYEKLFMSLTERLIDLGREIFEEHKDYKAVMARDRHTIYDVPWKEVDMQADQYVLRVFPASALPNDPAGRLAAIADLQAMGNIDRATANRLLDYPDLEADVSLDRAASDNIDRVLEKILDNGEWEYPEPFMDLQLALKKSQAWYNKALGENVPEKNLELLRQYMLAIEAEMQKAVAAQAMNSMGVPGLPSMPPGAGPTGQPPTALTPTDGSMAA